MDRPRAWAALTFDDGPNASYTTQILDTLKRYRIKAVFFLLGKNVEYYPSIARRIKKEGHLIGNHSYSHSHLTRLSKKKVLWQIERAERAYKEVLGVRPQFFRPPYGEYNKTQEELIKAKGYALIGWGPCAQDWKNPNAAVIARRIISQTRNSSIILLHDGANIRHNESRLNTVHALPIIIEGLKKRGFGLVRLDRICQGPKR